MNRFCRFCGATAIWATAALGQTATDQLVLDAETALTSGNPATALTLTETALADRPDNFAALFLHALALSELGRSADAAVVAARAYDAARTQDERLQAARLAGGARFAAGHYVRAEWWLRQAANHVGSGEDVATILAEFGRIREANPLSAQFNFSVAPSDNVNNGFEQNELIFDINGIPIPIFLREPLSGIEYVGDGRVTYKAADTDRYKTHLSGYVYHRAVTLSDQARDAQPLASNGDFALTVLEATVLHEHMLFPDIGPTSGSIGFGKLWYGGDRIWDYLTVSAGQDISLGDGTVLSFQGSLQDQKARQGEQDDTVVYGALGAIGFELADQSLLRFTLTGKLNETDNPDTTFNEISLAADYVPAQPFFGINWAFNAGLGQTDYGDSFTLTIDGRKDQFASLGATATFSAISYFGFSPSISVSGRKTESTFGPANATELQARIGISSNF